jgi:hypothetical protein
MSTNDHAFGSLAGALSGLVVDCFGLPRQPVHEYYLTHYHYDHVAYGRNFPKGLNAHLSQAKSLSALELVAPPTIINRYRQLGLTVNSEDTRIDLTHPDVNNGKHGIVCKSTSYLIGKVFWISETDSQSLLSKGIDDFLRIGAAQAEWVAVPPPDDTHFLSRGAVNKFVEYVCQQGRVPFTYAHAFVGSEKWSSITKSTDPKTGIGISSAPPIGVPMLPQVTETFQDVLGGRYSAPGTVRR